MIDPRCAAVTDRRGHIFHLQTTAWASSGSNGRVVGSVRQVRRSRLSAHLPEPDRTSRTDLMPIRSCGTFTHDLHDLAAWFRSCGVTSVAMESTGVYRIPAFEIQGACRARRIYSYHVEMSELWSQINCDFDLSPGTIRSATSEMTCRRTKLFAAMDQIGVGGPNRRRPSTPRSGRGRRPPPDSCRFLR